MIVQLPTGMEDVLLVEGGAPSVGLALALLSRVVTPLGPAPMDWRTLAPTDIDVLLLLVRRRMLGDLVTADVYCPSPGCHTRVDISFSIADFLEHHRPEGPHRLRAGSDAGWFALDDSDVEFRLPSAADQLAVALERDPEGSLLRRCIRPDGVSSEDRQRVETAMETLAPSLFGELFGTCPECAATVSADFDPLQYTLRELRDRAVYVFEDVCAIARHTHWSEADILAMPTARRLRYAELATVAAT